MTIENTNTDVAVRENGDLYDEDTGEYYYTFPEESSLPAKLAVFKDGYWYVYKIDGRYKQEEGEDEEESTEAGQDSQIAPEIPISLDMKDPLKDL